MKILIIDDEAAIVHFLKEGLSAQSYIVDSATDGERGSFMARTGSYDLIILDYMLPKLSGPEVLKEIRADRKKTPVLMLTVKSELDSKRAAFTGGADDYLTKPFLFEELLLRVQALVKRPAPAEGQSFRLGNLSLDVKSQIVRRGNRELYLTRREFCLLEYLFRNKGQIVSRSQIMDNVWDYDADPFSNSLETHIASLRRKISGRRQPTLIHTFNGRGYKLALTKLSGPSAAPAPKTNRLPATLSATIKTSSKIIKP